MDFKLMRYSAMKYVIVFAVVVSVYSFTQCYGLIARGEKVGLLKAVYCNLSFIHFIPRKFSLIDFFIHFVLWLIVGIILYRVYLRFSGGKPS